MSIGDASSLLACRLRHPVQVQVQLQNIHPRLAQQAELARSHVGCNQAPNRFFADVPLARHARHLVVRRGG